MLYETAASIFRILKAAPDLRGTIRLSLQPYKHATELLEISNQLQLEKVSLFRRKSGRVVVLHVPVVKRRTQKTKPRHSTA